VTDPPNDPDPLAELTQEEREFVIWALGYVEGAALEMHDDRTGYRASVIAEKLKHPPQSETSRPAP
jgi:hypothetical protein